jgi:hypothetical protein
MAMAHVDNVLRSLSSATSRRSLFAGLSGGLAAGLLSRDDIDSRQKRRQRKRKNKRKRRQGAKLKVAATCPGTGLLGSAPDDGNSRLAQTFVALESGPLVKARLAMLAAFGTSGDLELRLVEVDASSVPTDQVLAVSTVASERVPNERGDVDFTFADPFTVKAGAEYALVLTRPGGGQFGWFGEQGRRCPGRQFFSPDQVEPFTPSTNADFDHTFTVFVRS